MGSRTHYEVLGVSRKASMGEIKSAFRRLARIYHPDANPGMEGFRFRAINEAYKVLSDPAKRQAYDVELRALEKLPGPAQIVR